MNGSTGEIFSLVRKYITQVDLIKRLASYTTMLNGRIGLNCDLYCYINEYLRIRQGLVKGRRNRAAAATGVWRRKSTSW
jgi:hypothetical protein